jgi:hypothetical protein
MSEKLNTIEIQDDIEKLFPSASLLEKILINLVIQVISEKYNVTRK